LKYGELKKNLQNFATLSHFDWKDKVFFFGNVFAFLFMMSEIPPQNKIK
jgi:hypothetical protein